MNKKSYDYREIFYSKRLVFLPILYLKNFLNKKI